MGGRGAGGRIGVRDLTDSFGYFPNNAYLCGPQKVWGSHFFIVKPLTIKTVDTLSYKTVSKPGFTPHVDCGDNVIVINADKIRLTGKKMTDRVYVRYTGYPGGQRFTTPKEILASRPAELIRRSVRGMLPKTRLGDKLINNLYVYAGAEHPHQAQNPKTITLNEI